MVEIEDNLKFQDNPNIKNKIGEEQIYFSDKIQKKTVEMFSKTQERNFIITDLAVYNFKGTEIKRRIKIEDLKAITISTISNQFILHCNQNEYDYLYIYPDRKKITKVLQSAYEAKTNQDLLFCKKHEKDLSKFVVGKKERTKNPYMFKIEQNELTSIKDYIESEQQEEEPEPPKYTPPPPAPKSSGSAPTSVKVVAGKGKGVPPPPPPPPPPPMVPIATTKKVENKPAAVAKAAEEPGQSMAEQIANFKFKKKGEIKTKEPPKPKPMSHNDLLKQQILLRFKNLRMHEKNNESDEEDEESEEESESEDVSDDESDDSVSESFFSFLSVFSLGFSFMFFDLYLFLFPLLSLFSLLP